MALQKCKDCANDISSNAKACPKCGAPVIPVVIAKKSSGIMNLFQFILVVGVATAVGSQFFPKTEQAGAANSNSSTSPTAPPAAAPLATTPTKTSKTSLSDLVIDYDWYKSGLGNIAMLNGTIKNNGPTSVKDIKIACVGTASSGTKIDTKMHTLYEIVGAGKTIKFSDLNMGFIQSQVASLGCGIVDYTSN